ncbi:MAG: hypothetical protein GVX96_02290 [Bacteroidetes bacterium]|jgi:3-dehydroquinate synthase|nr:hypothetical protein [Bacteroidota bacterium]
MINKQSFTPPVYFPSVRACINELNKDSDNVFAVVDREVERRYGICDALNCPSLLLDANEERKGIPNVVNIWTRMSEAGLRRNSSLIAVGGGITTDTAGFAASCYMRGIGLILVPTSLLAMVDASIGGKTGVNFGAWKNRIGAFHLAKKVFIAPDFLKTLPREEWITAWAEVLKHGILHSSELLEWIFSITEFSQEMAIPPRRLKEIIEVKTELVNMDPFDLNVRQKLNAGHTIAHALESFSLKNNRQISHGRAVAAGLWIESEISFRENLLGQSNRNRLHNYIEEVFDLPKVNPQSIEDIIRLTGGDKKNKDCHAVYSLIYDFGDVRINQKPFDMNIKDALRSYINTVKNS